MTKITGYQWGHDKRFVGPYEFDENQDDAPLHMPPNTTLVEPPEVPPGQFARWEAARARWVLVPEQAPTLPGPVLPLNQQDPEAYEAREAAARAALIAKAEAENGN